MIGNANQVTACTVTKTLSISGLAQFSASLISCDVPGLRKETDRVIGVSMVTPPASGISLSPATVTDGNVSVVLFNAGTSLTTSATVDIIILVCRCDNFIGDGL